MFNYIPILLATLMASMDVVVLAWIKDYSLGLLSWKMIPIGMLLYGLQPLIFLQSLRYETMTVMNISWDLISDILVTATGLLYFKEKLTPMKQLGLGFAFIAIVLFACDDITCGLVSKHKK
jgi:multidrug transporter EmrE-like cation transporter